MGEGKKRKAGSNKSRRKQSEYQRHVHAQIGSGMANMPDGHWAPVGNIRDAKVRDRAERQAERFAP